MLMDCILWFLSEFKEIIIALIAVIGVFFTAFIALRNNNKNILIKTVTEERAKWRTELRDTCAEFSKLVYAQTNNANENYMSRIVELKAHIKLRTNPSSKPEHKLDQEIINGSQEIVTLLGINAENNEITEKLEKLESNVQKLLKQEWDKSKGEAVSGQIAK